jgi:hypothetical protein
LTKGEKYSQAKMNNSKVVISLAIYLYFQIKNYKNKIFYLFLNNFFKKKKKKKKKKKREKEKVRKISGKRPYM